jgi:hypothetical protein
MLSSLVIRALALAQPPQRHRRRWSPGSMTAPQCSRPACRESRSSHPPALHKCTGSQPIRPVVREICLAQHEQAGDRAHQVVVNPQARPWCSGQRDRSASAFRRGFRPRSADTYRTGCRSGRQWCRGLGLRSHPESPRYTASPVSPTPRPSSVIALALREATSRGTRLPKAG